MPKGMRNAKLRKRLWEKQGGKCCWCGGAMPAIFKGVARNVPNFPSLEHIIAKADGGSNRVENLALACVSCNSRRPTEKARITKLQSHGETMPGLGRFDPTTSACGLKA